MTAESDIYQQINKLSTNLANAYTALEGKGATLPVAKNFDNLANTVETIDFNDMANVITAINCTGTVLTKGSKVWVSVRNPTTHVIDGYYIVNFVDIADDTCYTAVTSENCNPLDSVDLFTVLDNTVMTTADNDDFTYEVIE